MKAVVSVFLLLPSLFVSLFGDSGLEDKIRIQNMKVVEAAAGELGKDLPKRVDPFTKLVAVEAEGEKLVYVFEIDAGGKSDESIVKEGRERMKRNVTAGICSTSQRFLKSGIVISYRYVSAATGKSLFEFSVDKKECDTLR